GDVDVVRRCAPDAVEAAADPGVGRTGRPCNTAVDGAEQAVVLQVGDVGGPRGRSPDRLEHLAGAAVVGRRVHGLPRRTAVRGVQDDPRCAAGAADGVDVVRAAAPYGQEVRRRAARL